MKGALQKSIKTQHLFVLICLLFYSCAQVVSPTGGAVDTVPPQIVKSIPKNASVNFNAKKIEIAFNEFIQLRELNNQLIVSPPLRKTPDIKVKNKTLSIEIEDTLKENTTYTFSFGNSIVDFTEGNALENFQYVFSTGSFLDSLTVSGKIEMAFNHVAEKGVLVMLYAAEKTLQDSFPYKVLPDYFGKTNELGNYSINNIRKGEYKIFALKDGNSNYLFDSDDERIAFGDSVLSITKPLVVNLELFQELKSKLFIKKPVRNAEGQLSLIFSKPTQNIALQSLLPEQKFVFKYLEMSKRLDTLNFWYAGAEGDSLKFKVLENGQILDTILVKIPTKENSGGRGERASVVSIRSNVNGDGTLDLNKKLTLQFASVLRKTNTARLRLTNRKLDVPLSFSFTDSLKRNALVDAKFVEDSSYLLLIPASSFEDYNGLKNDTVRLAFRIQSLRNYGTLKLAVKLPNEANYVLQMMDDKENVLREQVLNKSEIIFYEYVKPGLYKFKLLVDSNKNGRWDTGKFLEKKQAEKTIYYVNSLTVRANWDLEEVWDLTK
jgi:uncharacterized protein (DUF2141 family)